MNYKHFLQKLTASIKCGFKIPKDEISLLDAKIYINNN